MNTRSLPIAICCALFLLAVVSPAALAQCTDADTDGYFYEPACGTPQDCDDGSPSTYPGAPEICDGFDNNCDKYVDNSVACDGVCDVLQPLHDLSFPASIDARDYRAVWTGSDLAVSREVLIDNGVMVVGSDLYVARFDLLGNPLSDTRVTNSIPGDWDEYNRESNLVWNGSGFGVVWERLGGNLSLIFQRLDDDGNLLGEPVTLTTDIGHSSIALAWNGNGYGVAWQNDGRVWFMPLDASGNPLAPFESVSEHGATYDKMSMLWTGAEYTVVWEHAWDDSYGFRFRRLDRSGAPLGPTVVATTTAPHGDGVGFAWSGREFGLAWQSHNSVTHREEIRFVRLDARGSPLGPVFLLTDSPAGPGDVRVASTGAEFLVSWVLLGEPIVLARIDASGDPVGAPLTTTRQPNHDSLHFPLWTGSEYVVVWVGWDGAGTTIAETRFSCGCTSIDEDSDGFTSCGNDCDDHDATIYPGAAEICDGLANDCVEANWPVPFADDRDDDFDGVSPCAGDCDGSDGSVYPGAPQLCDGLNNDCGDASWPAVASDETDDDGDTYAECQGDCNDGDPAVAPGLTERCNGIDDDCDLLSDEDDLGEDSDSDGVHNVCDNCRDIVNPSQLDTDEDNWGNSCDNCVFTPNPGQANQDSDDRGDLCDNCVQDYNPAQDDWDSDSAGDACDNCIFDPNPTQSDMDADWEGDHCDYDDGLILVLFHDPMWVEWQEESGYASWSCYEGDLSVLRESCAATGCEYTQLPGGLASRVCDVTDPWMDDFAPPGDGEGVFFLTTGIAGGEESTLGTDSMGTVRTNANPCP